MRRGRNGGVIEELRSAARGGELSAAFALGRIFEEGWGVKPSFPLAFTFYRAAAEGGLGVAFHYVGMCYHLGQGVRKNQAKAFQWFELSASCGDLASMYMRALCKIEGLGVKRSQTTGLKWMKSTARKGSADAADYLADFYVRHNRVKEAKYWQRRAHALGSLLTYFDSAD